MAMANWLPLVRGQVPADEASTPLLGGYVEPAKRSRSILRASPCLSLAALASLLMLFVIGMAPTAKQRLMHATELPLCQRTLLIDYSSWWTGSGSAQLGEMQAAIWAKAHGFTVLFPSDPSPYGSYASTYRSAPLTCRTTPDMYDLAACLRGDAGCIPLPAYIVDPTPSARIYAGMNEHFVLNEWTKTRYLGHVNDLTTRLPLLDATAPLPNNASIPSVMERSFDGFEQAFTEHFSFNGVMIDRVEATRLALSLQFDDPHIPFIGLHWRGGDKHTECLPSTRLTCGNVTLYAEAAWEAVQRMPESKRQRRPTLAVLSAEPDAVDLFRSDPVGSRFNVIEMPHTRKDQAGFDQGRFDHMSEADRLADTHTFFANLAVLTWYADAFIVSNNSNIGRISMLRAGKQRVLEGHIVSVDLYWFPTIYILVPPKCGGLDHCDP